MLSEELFFLCPYCWQRVSMVFETSQPMFNYVEDCEVCCKPININYQPRESSESDLEVSRLDE